MILLTSISDVIRVVTTDGTGILDVHASWVDNAAGTITPGRTDTAPITLATTTTVVAAPAASTQRTLKHLLVRNDDPADPNTVTIEHFDGTQSPTLFKCILQAGESVTYEDGIGWQRFTSRGHAGLEWRRLSASTNGLGVIIAAIATPGTTVHTGIVGTESADFVELWAINNNASGVTRTLTVEWGGIVATSGWVVPVPPKAGPVLITPPGGLPIRNAGVIAAYADVASEVIVFGKVHPGLET